jgi:hypothetical protein
VDYDTTLLAKLGATRQRHERALQELRPQLVEEIRAAGEAGVLQAEIVRLTGYTREQVRKICLPPDQREAEEQARRDRRRKPATKGRAR